MVIYSVVPPTGFMERFPSKTVGLIAFGQSEIWANFEFVSKYKMKGLFQYLDTIKTTEGFAVKVYDLKTPYINVSRHIWVTFVEEVLDYGYIDVCNYTVGLLHQQWSIFEGS